MKIKEILWEQTLPTEQNDALLRKALSLGCFVDLQITVEPSTPIKNKEGVSVLKAKGKSGKTYHIFADPKKVTDENGVYIGDWECPQLDSKQSQVKSDIETLKVSREEQSGVNCIETIRELYENFIAVKKGGAQLNTDVVTRLQKNAQACLIKPEVKRKLFLTKIPGINQRFEKIFDELKAINPRDTRLKYFRLVENDSVKSLIKRTLKEAKQKKETREIETKIFESRMKLVFESYEKFDSLDKKNQVKVGFKTLKEISDIQKLGLVTETLGTLFKGLYGNSYENTIGTISKPLFEVIFTKIMLDEELKNSVLQSIQSKTQELIASMDSCLDLSKFLADLITEEYAKKLDKEKQEGLDVVKTALMDAVDDEMFRKNLQTKLETEICVLYEKFTENAKNLMVRMSAL